MLLFIYLFIFPFFLFGPSRCPRNLAIVGRRLGTRMGTDHELSRERSFKGGGGGFAWLSLFRFPFSRKCFEFCGVRGAWGMMWWC